MTNLFSGSRLYLCEELRGYEQANGFGGLGLTVVRVQVIASFEDPAVIKRILGQWDRPAGPNAVTRGTAGP